jgi:hypothetical protein
VSRKREELLTITRVGVPTIIVDLDFMLMVSRKIDRSCDKKNSHTGLG